MPSGAGGTQVPARPLLVYLVRSFVNILPQLSENSYHIMFCPSTNPSPNLQAGGGRGRYGEASFPIKIQGFTIPKLVSRTARGRRICKYVWIRFEANEVYNMTHDAPCRHFSSAIRRSYICLQSRIRFRLTVSTSDFHVLSTSPIYTNCIKPFYPISALVRTGGSKVDTLVGTSASAGPLLFALW
jgi:hypothetical protein